MVCKKAANSAAMGLGLAGLALGVVALATNKWLESSSSNTGLWVNCNGADCSEFAIGSDIKYKNYETVRGFGVLSVALMLGGVAVSLISCMKWLDATVSATLYLMGAFFALIACSLFTSLSQGVVGESFGYSFGLGWASFPCALIAGGIMTYVEFTCDDE